MVIDISVNGETQSGPIWPVSEDEGKLKVITEDTRRYQDLYLLLDRFY